MNTSHLGSSGGTAESLAETVLRFVIRVNLVMLVIALWRIAKYGD